MARHTCVALSIKNIKTRASREMTSRKKNGGERCQALECGRARYLPSLIALLSIAFFVVLMRLQCDETF